MSSELEAVREAVTADGGLLAAALVEGSGEPVTTGADLRARVIELVREGYLLHHGDARVVSQTDPDLALLAGDRLYALGLQQLAGAGDLQAISVLAELIAAGARAHAAGEPEVAEELWNSAIGELEG